METLFSIELPNWTADYTKQPDRQFASPEEKMHLVIELARRNVQENTGGPFAAAVFEQNSGRIVSIGLNLVTFSGLSMAHAEIVALSLAQKALSQYRLSNRQDQSYELFTSCRPCAMCLGAIPWSGVASLICAAGTEDAEAIGFDEGQKPLRWENGLRQRGIQVCLDVLRQLAADVLKDYKKQGGKIY